jgi:hypothetical protein
VEVQHNRVAGISYQLDQTESDSFAAVNLEASWLKVRVERITLISKIERYGVPSAASSEISLGNLPGVCSGNPSVTDTTTAFSTARAG